MNDRLKALYKTQILTYAKDASNEGELSDSSVVLEAYNPLCGDKYTLYVLIENGLVASAKFKGYGCAISKAATAILIERIIGKRPAEVKTMIDLFMEVIDEGSDKKPEDLTTDEALLAFAATRDFPERKKCASLSWEALQNIEE